ncbi:SET domain-containing protein-lysine N-methyltransferase [Candidatus Woesearchaeota archaeon]|nr:SET domain-containing protein-lysine N-methyltransferase [Candidatus Woesearchaeota archaeon]
MERPSTEIVTIPVQESLVVRETTYGAGKGVYAQRQLLAGEEAFIFGEKIVPWAKATHRGIQLGRNKWLEPPKESFGFYLNHSCSPSCGFQLPNKIVVLREMKESEEITIDYSTVVHTQKWEMDCLCQSPQCRKIVKSYLNMPPEFQEKYTQWNSWEG